MPSDDLRTEFTSAPTFLTRKHAVFDVPPGSVKVRSVIKEASSIHPSSIWSLRAGRVQYASFRHSDIAVLEDMLGGGASAFLPFYRLVERPDVFLPGARNIQIHLVSAVDEIPEGLRIDSSGFRMHDVGADEEKDLIVDMPCAAVEVSPRVSVDEAKDGPVGSGDVPLDLCGLVSHISVRVLDADDFTVEIEACELIVQGDCRVESARQRTVEDGTMILELTNEGGVVRSPDDHGVNFSLLDHARLRVRTASPHKGGALKAIVHSVHFDVLRTRGGRVERMLV